MQRIRITANQLQTGDIVGSGETVIQLVLNSISWPSHKVKVVLQKDDRIRHVLWSKYTVLGVIRS